MDFAQLLLSISVREKSGSRTAAAYDFQKYWGIAEILRRHSGPGDYCVIFEHHEDVIVIDSSESPSVSEFYQIKTKRNGYWTIPALLKRDAGIEAQGHSSILGKLLQNLVKFPAHTKGLYFVSNAPFKVDLRDADCPSVESILICVRMLNDETLKKVREKIVQELGFSEEVTFESITFLQRTDLNVQDTETHIKGILQNFFEQRFPEHSRFPIKPFLKTLFGEVRRRSTFQDSCTSFRDLVEKKGVSRAFFERLIVSSAASQNPEESWNEAHAHLLSEGASFRYLQELKIAWRRYELQRPNNEDLVLQELRGRVEAHICRQPPSCKEKLFEYLEKSTQTLAAETGNRSNVEVQAIFLFELMTSYAAAKLQAASPKPSEKGQ